MQFEFEPHTEDVLGRKPVDDLGFLFGALRIMLPGTQVLFAFLLIIPFSSRWTEVTLEERIPYLVAFLFAGLSVSAFIAPSIHHRLNASDEYLPVLLRDATVLLPIGVIAMGISMVAVVYLVVQVLLGNFYGSIAAASIGLGTALVWFGPPLLWNTRRLKASD